MRLEKGSRDRPEYFSNRHCLSVLVGNLGRQCHLWAWFFELNPVVMVLWPKTLQQLPKSNIEFSNVHNSAVLWAIFDEKEAPDRKSMSAIRWKGRNVFISDKNEPNWAQYFLMDTFFQSQGGVIVNGHCTRSLYKKRSLWQIIVKRSLHKVSLKKSL